MTRIIGLGAGGHAKVVIEILRQMPECEVAGLLDSDSMLWGKQICGAEVLGGDQLLARLFLEGVRHGFIGVGSVGDSTARRKLHSLLTREGFQLVSAVHPGAIVSPSVHHGAGATIMAGAIINADARLGDNVIINTGAIVEHDCVIGDHVHIATGARLAGTVIVGDGAHVGIGATIRQGIRIGSGAVVGAGAVVVKDVAENTVVTGVPARAMQTTPNTYA